MGQTLLATGEPGNRERPGDNGLEQLAQTGDHDLSKKERREMSGYSIYTLWGELADSGERAPVEVAVAVDFFEVKQWKVVVEREDKTGFVVQRDVTQGLTLGEALTVKENLVRVCQADGFMTLNNLNFYSLDQAYDGGRTTIFLDVESR